MAMGRSTAVGPYVPIRERLFILRICMQDVTVARVDPGLGVLLEAAKAIPPTAGYAHISQLADERVEKADKKFRPGQVVKARVLGSRPMDGLATFTLQPSAVNAQFATASEAAPGAIVSGTILSVEEYGLLVSLTQTIRCALSHMLDMFNAPLAT